MNVGVLVKKEDICEFPLTQLPDLLCGITDNGKLLSIMMGVADR